MTDSTPSDFAIQQLLHGGTAQLGELFNSINSAPLALRTHTADKFFARVFTRNPLDPAFTPLLEQLKTIFVNQACQTDAFYCDPNHPLRELFNCLIARASTWYPRETKLNQQFFAQLSNLLELAVSLPDAAGELASALQEFNRWDDAETQRAAMLEARLCESELNYLKMLTAECQVLDLINEALTGCRLPANFIEFIPRCLKSELQHCAVTAGYEAPLWKLWQRLLPAIAEIYNSEDTAEQQLYQHIPALLHWLEHSLEMEIADLAQYREMVEGLIQALLQTIKRQPPELAVLTMLPYPAGHSDTRVRATDSVRQQAATIAQGDWILFDSDDGHTIRCKLALKNPTSEQLLFVDRSGRKVMIKSSKDVSLCLSTGIAQHLTLTPLTELIAELVQALITLQRDNLHKLAAAAMPAAAQEPEHSNSDSQDQAPTISLAEQNIRDEQQRRALEFAERRRLAAERALVEARVLADAKSARTRALAEQNLHQQNNTPSAEQLPLALAQQQVSALNVGAWIERLDYQQQKQRCKLAVIIAAAGKYIFVDSIGRKVAEYQREGLLEAFVHKQITIINNGDKFEDQLVKVIRSLRKDVS